MSDELHDVRCSCGQEWKQISLEEADQIAREHDDSPFTKHVVSSPTAWRATSRDAGEYADQPSAIRFAIALRDPAEYCISGRCGHTNWGGRDRLHMRGSECPPFDSKEIERYLKAAIKQDEAAQRRLATATSERTGKIRVTDADLVPDTVPRVPDTVEMKALLEAAHELSRLSDTLLLAAMKDSARSGAAMHLITQASEVLRAWDV